jgi:hypothetical protein
VRQRGLAHSDRPDVRRLDENDLVESSVQESDKGGGGHPAGATAAHDHDFADDTQLSAG